ncbi:MAG: Ribose transport system, permease protein RbsC [Polyangiaceae bacterium]|jgi:ribose transport system permease protein|nr:Ribose transport system, permease protein RbsC [Polyangiaceae bacterium]
MTKTLLSWLKKPWFGPLVALVLVYALFAALTPDTFLRTLNLVTMLRQTVVVAIAAVGMALIIIHGGIDLSVGSTVALTTVIAAKCLQSGMSPGATVLTALALGAVAGACNGLLVVGLRIAPFIATLGTMSAWRGIAKGLADEQKIDAPARGIDEWMAVVPGERLVPHGVWVALLAAVFCALLLGYTKLGRHAVAVGSNEHTARLCGVPVARVRLAIYALGGLLAGVAGVLEFSTLTVGDPTDSVGLELEAIAAVVIGGGSLSGGQGSVAGTLLGALLLTVIKAGCTHLGMPNWIQEILTGAIIVVAMTLDRVRQNARD